MCVKHALSTRREIKDFFGEPKKKIIKIVSYLTIIPRARMGSESKTHEAEGQMGY